MKSYKFGNTFLAFSLFLQSQSVVFCFLDSSSTVSPHLWNKNEIFEVTTRLKKSSRTRQTANDFAQKDVQSPIQQMELWAIIKQLQDSQAKMAEEMCQMKSNEQCKARQIKMLEKEMKKLRKDHSASEASLKMCIDSLKTELLVSQSHLVQSSINDYSLLKRNFDEKFNVLDGIKSEILGQKQLGNSLRQVNEDFSKFQQELNSIHRKFKKNTLQQRQQEAEINQKVKHIENRTQTLQEKVQNITTSLDENFQYIRIEFQNMMMQIDHLSSSTNETLQELKLSFQKINEMQTNPSSFGTNSTNFQLRVRNLEDEMQGQECKFAHLTYSMQTERQTTHDLVEIMQAQLQELDNRMSNISLIEQAIKGKVQKLEDDFCAFKLDLNSLESSNKNHQEEFCSFQKDVKQILGEIEAFESSNTLRFISLDDEIQVAKAELQQMCQNLSKPATSKILTGQAIGWNVQQDHDANLYEDMRQEIVRLKSEVCQEQKQRTEYFTECLINIQEDIEFKIQSLTAMSSEQIENLIFIFNQLDELKTSFEQLSKSNVNENSNILMEKVERVEKLFSASIEDLKATQILYEKRIQDLEAQLLVVTEEKKLNQIKSKLKRKQRKASRKERKQLKEGYNKLKKEIFDLKKKFSQIMGADATRTLDESA